MYRLRIPHDLECRCKATPDLRLLASPQKAQNPRRSYHKARCPRGIAARLVANLLPMLLLLVLQEQLLLLFPLPRKSAEMF